MNAERNWRPEYGTPEYWGEHARGHISDEQAMQDAARFYGHKGKRQQDGPRPIQPSARKVDYLGRRAAAMRAKRRLGDLRLPALDLALDRLTDCQALVGDYLITKGWQSANFTTVKTYGQIAEALKISERSAVSAVGYLRDQIDGFMLVRTEKVAPNLNAPNVYVMLAVHRRKGMKTSARPYVNHTNKSSLHAEPPTVDDDKPEAVDKSAGKCRGSSREETASSQFNSADTVKRRVRNPPVPDAEFQHLGMATLRRLDPTLARQLQDQPELTALLNQAADHLLDQHIPNYDRNFWDWACNWDRRRATLAVFETLMVVEMRAGSATYEPIRSPARYLAGILKNNLTGSRPEVTLHNIIEGRRRARGDSLWGKEGHANPH